MEELRNCILSDETAHGRDHPRRRIYNFIANSTLTIDAMVHCKQSNGMLSNAVFRVTTQDGDDAYLKVMPVEEYRQWRDVYDGLARHGLQRLHPAVGRHGEVPNGADRPLFGYSVIEAFGRSIHDIEDSEGRIGRELFLDMKDFLKGALRSLHERGLFHGDVISDGSRINKGNVLCRMDENRSCEFRLIDFGSLHHNPAESLRIEQNALVRLQNIMPPRERKRRPRRPERSPSRPRRIDLAQTFPPRRDQSSLARPLF